MKTRIILILLAMAAIGCIVAGVLLNNKPAAIKPAPEKIATAVPPKIEQSDTPEKPAPVVPEIKPKAEVATAPEKPAASPLPQKAAPPKDPVTDPVARVALSLVGVDPGAEQYWLASIFDSSLPDQEREDLMEDLNEEGLSDPKHPGPEDLPLIMNRLAIINDVLPYADEFMVPHLLEAGKDLSNLANGGTAK